jgi:hypothetical protein
MTTFLLAFSASSTFTKAGALVRSPPWRPWRSYSCSLSGRAARSSTCASGPAKPPSTPPKNTTACAPKPISGPARQTRTPTATASGPRPRRPACRQRGGSRSSRGHRDRRPGIVTPEQPTVARSRGTERDEHHGASPSSLQSAPEGRILQVDGTRRTAAWELPCNAGRVQARQPTRRTGRGPRPSHHPRASNELKPLLAQALRDYRSSSRRRPDPTIRPGRERSISHFTRLLKSGQNLAPACCAIMRASIVLPVPAAR